MKTATIELKPGKQTIKEDNKKYDVEIKEIQKKSINLTDKQIKEIWETYDKFSDEFVDRSFTFPFYGEYFFIKVSYYLDADESEIYISDASIKIICKSNKNDKNIHSPFLDCEVQDWMTCTEMDDWDVDVKKDLIIDILKRNKIVDLKKFVSDINKKIMSASKKIGIDLCDLVEAFLNEKELIKLIGKRVK